MADQRNVTQVIVETDVNQTDRQRRIAQVVVEVDLYEYIEHSLSQMVIEVDLEIPQVGRILGPAVQHI